MDSIGKTAFPVKLAQYIQKCFDDTIRRSLNFATTLETILGKLIILVSPNVDLKNTKTTENKIFVLLDFLRSVRYLII